MLLRRPSSVIRPLVTALVNWLDGHRCLALMAFILSRALPFALRLALLIGPHSDRPFDIVRTWQAARLAGQGLFPYIHYWAEYPPLYPWLSVLIYGLSRMAPLGPNGRLTFYAVLGALLIAAEVGTVILIYRLAAAAGSRRTAMQAVLLYACLSVPLYLYTSWFDTIPAFLFLLALERLTAGRLAQSALAAAIGGLFKVFPLLAIPVAWRALRSWDQRLRYTAIAGAVIVITMAPFILISPAMTAAWAQATLTRSSWETIWALAEGYTGFGLVAPLALRTDPASASLQAHPSTLPWPLITLVLILALIGLFTRPLNLTYSPGGCARWTEPQSGAALQPGIQPPIPALGPAAALRRLPWPDRRNLRPAALRRQYAGIPGIFLFLSTAAYLAHCRRPGADGVAYRIIMGLLASGAGHNADPVEHRTVTPSLPSPIEGEGTGVAPSPPCGGGLGWGVNL